MKTLLALLTFALALAAGAPAQADDFYKSGLQMGTAGCLHAEIDCANLSRTQSAIISAANQCISERFQIPESIMTEYKMSGEFENCVIPDHMYKGGDGVGTWAICCVKKESDACYLSCTRFIAH